jgi:NAD(P)-dependent dehydrogenase (short-subunit alcohol dehydrogenase family)
MSGTLEGSSPAASGALAGRGAVVTGGGRGIGAAIARALAAEGARVVVAARTAAEVERVAQSIVDSGGLAGATTCDVTDPTSVDALFDAAEERLGATDILVNNAGIAHSALVTRTTLDDWRRILDVNATGTFLCTRAFLPAMMERGWGRVVNVASVAGLAGDRFISAYAAAKHAVVGFTRSVAAEAGPHGVTVNAVCPGWVDTDMTRASIARIVAATGRSEEEALAAILSASSQRRLIDPAEVAEVAVRLCREESREVNGQAIVIDEVEAHA